MSYIVEFDHEPVWGGANWVFREMWRRMQAEIDAEQIPTVTALLRSPRLEGERLLRLADAPKHELALVLGAAKAALAKSQDAGAEGFASQEFFAAFLDRFREFIQLLSAHLG